jgi:hypothetical protein
MRSAQCVKDPSGRGAKHDDEARAHSSVVGTIDVYSLGPGRNPLRPTVGGIDDADGTDGSDGERPWIFSPSWAARELGVNTLRTQTQKV